MRYSEFLPAENLRGYIKCFYLFESEEGAPCQDTVFSSGNMEIIFNLGEGIWKTASDGVYHTTPQVECWGQITRPLPVESVGKQCMLGVRLYAHAPLYPFAARDLNDQVVDAGDVLGHEIRDLHAQLLETPSTKARMAMVEKYFLKKLRADMEQPGLIGALVGELQGDVSVKSLAGKYRMSPRYLQKLFIQHTGISPKFYHQVNRFQQSLKLMGHRESSLTSIAYDCGYFDQSHFIREFKSFTGIAPSEYTSQAYPVSVTLSK